MNQSLLRDSVGLGQCYQVYLYKLPREDFLQFIFLQKLMSVPFKFNNDTDISCPFRQDL